MSSAAWLVGATLALAVFLLVLRLLRPGTWQIANVLSFLANVAAVRSIPRLDSENPMLQPVNYLTPAAYAFAIWAVIYLLEFGLMCWQLLPRARSEVLRRVSPWWCGANACQVLWCFAFRPALDSPALGWVSAVALTSIAAYLGRAHTVLAAKPNTPQVIFFYIPITLHFGWTSAAALVNWNGYVARCTSAVAPKLAAALLSAALATYLGTSITAERRSALYGATVTWALLAVAVETLRSERLALEIGRHVAKGLGGLELALAAGLLALSAGVAVAGQATGSRCGSASYTRLRS